jgi:hypothetical protein
MIAFTLVTRRAILSQICRFSKQEYCQVIFKTVNVFKLFFQSMLEVHSSYT